MPERRFNAVLRLGAALGLAILLAWAALRWMNGSRNPQDSQIMPPGSGTPASLPGPGVAAPQTAPSFSPRPLKATTGFSGEVRFLEKLAGSKVLFEEETRADPLGHFKRKRIYELEPSLELVRLEQSLELDPGGTEKILTQDFMSGERLMVSLLPGVDLSRLSDFLKMHDATILKQLRGSGIVLIQFDGRSSASAMERLMDALVKSGLTTAPSPDLIRFLQ